MRPKHRRFVDEYLIDLNATQAAIRAGYSAKTANREGSRLLSNADIAAAIEAGFKARAAETKVNATRVVQELAAIAFADIRQVFSWSESGVVRVKPSDQLTRDEAVCISAIEDVATANGRTIKVKMHDKLAALTALGRHLGMFVDRHELGTKDGQPFSVNVIVDTPPEYQRWLQEQKQNT